MNTHEITVSSDDVGVLWMECSCREWEHSPGSSAPLAELYEAARKHMEETFPVRLVEEMNRPTRISAKDLGLTDDDARRLLGKAGS